MPKRPPVFERADLARLLNREGFWALEPEGYLHWDELRHREPPEGLSHEDWWMAVRLIRMSTRRTVPLEDKEGKRFSYCLVDPIPERLHHIDRNASGRIEVPEEIVNPSTRDRYVISSLIEESYRSSQIEGAVTTHKAAKEMIRQGRRPRNKSERMVLNNYRTMEHIRDVRKEQLTPELVFELHRKMTDGTLDDPADAGRFRRETDGVTVVDEGDGQTMHIPPKADELPRRLEALCEFANGRKQEGFLNPILRAIILHFWLAYDHPFVDGNGRCARALFYWSMLHEGYWLCEFLSISHVVQRTSQQYYRAFLYTETDENDLTYFVLYHLKVIRQAIIDLNKYLERKAKQVRQVERRLRSTAFLNHRQRDVLTDALRHPDRLYTIEEHRRSHNVVYQTARTDLLDLTEKGLLEKRKRGRALVFYVPPDLQKKLDSDTTQ